MRTQCGLTILTVTAVGPNTVEALDDGATEVVAVEQPAPDAAAAARLDVVDGARVRRRRVHAGRRQVGRRRRWCAGTGNRSCAAGLPAHRHEMKPSVDDSVTRVSTHSVQRNYSLSVVI